MCMLHRETAKKGHHLISKQRYQGKVDPVARPWLHRQGYVLGFQPYCADPLEPDGRKIQGDQNPTVFVQSVEGNNSKGARAYVLCWNLLQLNP